MSEQLTEEDVFSNDVDPLDGIRELRRAEGVAEEDLIAPADSVLAADSDIKDELPVDTDLDAFETPAEPEAKLDEIKDEEEDTPLEKDPKNADDPEVIDGDEKQKPDSTETAKLKFRANGQDFEFTPEEVQAQFETVFGQAMDYTQKLQKIAPYRKMISAIEEEGITQEQLNIAIDALKGDKGALTKLLEANDIDKYDLGNDEEAPYVPGDYGKEESQQELAQVASIIAADPEYKITVDVIDNQWDGESRDVLRKNPKFIQGLHNDIKSGVYAEVAVEAMKMKVLDRNSKSDIEYYMLAGQQRSANQQTQNAQGNVDALNKQTQDAVAKADTASSEAQQKRAATSTGARADRKGVVDYLDDNDEDYDAWYAKLQASV